MNDLEFDPQTRGSGLRRTYLLDLIVVVIDSKKNEPELLHRAPSIALAERSLRTSARLL